MKNLGTMKMMSDTPFENFVAPTGNAFPEATQGEIFALDGHAALPDGTYVYLHGNWHKLDDGHSGPIVKTYTQAAHGFVALDSVRLSAGTWTKALADDLNTLAMAMVVEIIDVNTFRVANTGSVKIVAHGLAVDNYYYLSNSVVGGIDSVEPPISQPVLYVEDADHVWLLPYRPAVISNPNVHPAVWRDLFAPLTAAKPTGNTAPTWSEIANGAWAYAFADNANQELQVSFHLDHDYAPGTEIFPHIHWQPSSTGTGTVRWVFTVWHAKGHSQQAFNWGNPNIVIVEHAASGTIYDHMVAEVGLSAITADLEPDTMIIINVKREGTHISDTYVGDAFGLQMDIHYQATYLGTNNKAPDFYT